MQIIDVNGVKLHYADEGNPNGYPVVFSNSLGTDFRLWNRVTSLMPGNFRLIRYDKRGHGLSSCPDGGWSIGDLTRDCEELLDRLGIHECLFVGLSIGGLAAQHLAINRPDLVRAVVMSNTGARIGERTMWLDRIDAARADRLSDMSDAVLERWFSSRFRQECKDELEGWRAMLTRTTRQGYAGCCEAIMEADFTEEIGSVQMPVLLIGGSEDGATPPDLVRWTASLIPHAKLRIIEGAGHLPCIEKPEEYASCLMEFIRASAIPTAPQPSN